MPKSSPFILDPSGRKFGTKWSAYQETKNGLIRLTPEGFPHQRQLEYLESDALHTLYAGMRGSGKTFVSVWDTLFAAHWVPGSEQIFFRRTLNELKHTVVKEFLNLPEDLRGHFTDSLTSPRLVLPNESVIHFASVNTYEAATKYQGRQFYRITFDEWALIPYEWWSFIVGSLRTPILYDVEGQPISPQVKGLSNPGGPGSDTLRRLFGADCEKHCPPNLELPDYSPKDYCFVRSNLDDNPVYREGTPAGDAYRKVLKGRPPAIRAAWLEGRWTGFEGMYFDTFNLDYTKVPHDLILTLMAQQYWMPVFLGIDVGEVHHAYCCWNTVLQLPLADGTQRPFIVTFDEWLGKGLSERGIAGAILDKMRGNHELKKRINRIYLSPETFGEAARTRARVIGDVFVQDQVCRPTPAKSEKNSRVNGLRSMYTLLSERHQVLHPITLDKEGMACDWLISSNCTELLSALPWAASDPDKPGDIKKEGDAQMLDVLDGTRYAIYTHRLTMMDQPPVDKQKDSLKMMGQTNAPETFSMKRYAEYVKELRESERVPQTRSGAWTSERHKWRQK